MPKFSINHVAIAVPRIERFLETHRPLYGDFKRSAVITNDRQGVNATFLSDGTAVIELLEPSNPSSPITGFLQKNRRGGLVHVALDVDDLDATLLAVADHGGAVVAGPAPDVAFNGRRIAFVVLDGQVTELIERPSTHDHSHLKLST